MPSTTHFELPALDELHLAEFKVGSYTSDLDAIRSQVERTHRGETKTVDEYLEAREEGRLPEKVEFDPAQLARLVAFAAAALEDADLIREHAVAIQHVALALLAEAEPPDDAYDASIRAWAAEYADYGSDARRSRLERRTSEEGGA